MQFLYNVSWGFVVILFMIGLALLYTGFFYFLPTKKNNIETPNVQLKMRINVMSIGGLVLMLFAMASALVKWVA